jgi:hypothetical protein
MRQFVLRLVKERGYERIATAASRNELMFRKGLSEEFASFLNLRYLRTQGAYEVTLGVKSEWVSGQVEQAITAVYGHDIASELLDQRPCVTLFNADALVDWPHGALLANDEVAIRHALDHLFLDVVIPKFELTLTRSALLELLLRTEPPFQWTRCDVAVRLAQIAVLSAALRRDWHAIKLDILAGERLLEKHWLLRDVASRFSDDLYLFVSVRAGPS